MGIGVYLVDQRFHLKTAPDESKGTPGSEKAMPFTVGTEDWPWFNGLSLRIERVIGLPEGEIRCQPVLAELDWKLRMTTPLPGAQVDNQPQSDALVSVFVLDPESSQSLKLGRYVIKATWRSTEPPADKLPIWHGRLQAEDASITITVANTLEERGELAYSSAAYYMRHKDYEKAIANALEAEKVSPGYQMYGCYDIAARAYDAKDDLGTALCYYRKYAEAHKDANPQRWPYILAVRERIKNLEAQLKQSESSQQQVKPDDKEGRLTAP